MDECSIVVLAMGRRWGKTVFGEVLCCTFVAYGAKVAWVVPSYKNGRPLWRMLKRTLGELVALRLVRINETDRTVEFDPSIGGGYLGMYSGEDNCDAMRGEDFDLVVIDEAAKVSEIAWTDVIQPTLADRNGRAVLISTPRGQNWFFVEWLRGQDPEQQRVVRSFTAPTSANPIANIQRAFRLARERVSSRTFQQEWQAEFLSDGGEVFRNVEAVSTAQPQDRPTHPQTRYVAGVDLAKSEDYTVIAIADAVARRQVAEYRFHNDSWPLQKARIQMIAWHWNNMQIWLDSTGVGSPIYDDLRAAGLNVVPFTFTAATKQSAYENAVVMLEQGRCELLDVPAQKAELKAIQYKKTAAGNIRIEAPSGMHDDYCSAIVLMLLPLAHDHAGLPAQALEALRGSVSAIGGTRILGKVL